MTTMTTMTMTTMTMTTMMMMTTITVLVSAAGSFGSRGGMIVVWVQRPSEAAVEEEPPNSPTYRATLEACLSSSKCSLGVLNFFLGGGIGRSVLAHNPP